MQILVSQVGNFKKEVGNKNVLEYTTGTALF